MKDMLQNYLLGALACIIVGIALLINPHILTQTLNTAVAVILIACGAIGILGFIISKSKDSKNDKSFLSLLVSAVILVCGIYLLKHTDLLEKLVMICLGLYLLCSGIPKLITAVKLRKLRPESWLTPFITSAATVALGTVMLFMPGNTTEAIMRIAAVILIVGGTVNFMSGFTGTRVYDKIRKDIQYSGGKGTDKKDAHDDDKKNAIDV